MRNFGIMLVAAIVCLGSLFSPISISAASERNITAYIPTGISLATERVIFNALSSVGITCTVEERLSGRDSFAAVQSQINAVAAGISDYSALNYTSNVVKVDIPIGTVEYTAYTATDADFSVASWQDAQALAVDVLENSNYIMSQLETYSTSANLNEAFEKLLNGETDVFIAAVYDNVETLLPTDIKVSGVLDSSETYIWYNKNQTELGDLIKTGLENIQANGVWDRIASQKSVRENNPKVILQLSSYSNQMIWENQAEQTLRETLDSYDQPISLYIYNMNFRRTNYRSAQYKATSDYIRATFMNEYPDVIIAMDNDALGYLQENYKKMFNGVPVVYCGINGFSEELISEFSDYATGINEYIDPTETVEFALAHNPNLKTIYTIFDETSSASPVKDSLLATIEEKYGDRLDIISNEGLSFQEIAAEVQGFNDTVMPLIGTYFSDKDGQFMPESEVAERLSQAAGIPVYTLMSGYLGYGVVGGRVAYSRSFIEEAANRAVRILNGEPVETILPVGNLESEQRFNAFIVDKNAADRFGISESLYANRAIVLNEDLSVFEAYPVQSTIGISLIVIITITAILCIMLMNSNHKHKIAERQAEYEKENNHMKSDFLARMSHEIRTPLNAIIGMDELILRENIPQTVHRNALVILHSGRSLLSIINDILDFSKIESGKMELVMTDFDVGSLIYDTVSMSRVRAAEKPIEVNMSISNDFPAFLYGDEIRVRQILLNLLTNSIKYTKQGTVMLKAEFEFDTEAKTSGLAVYTISDTGVGIKAEDIDKLFDAFSQADTKSNRKVEGTGLGLSITKTLVELMGGSINVKSEFGKGSEFTVSIRHEVHDYKPLEDASAAFSRQVENEGKHQNIRFTAPDAAILAVDDVAANLMVITGLLSPYEMRIDTASSGEEAIEAVQKKDYDFIFMDHMMPEMDGIEATEIIRTLNDGKYSHIPIIALTANAVSGMKEMFLVNGFSDFISKPIETDELDNIIHKWIPKEKQLATDGHNNLNKTLNKSIYAIDCIDVENGLNRFRGDVNSYESILRVFATDLNASLNTITNYLADEKFEELQLKLHSIKGMAGNAACTEIFEMSKNLDNSIRIQDYGYVREHFDEFIEKAKAAAESILDNLEAGTALHNQW